MRLLVAVALICGTFTPVALSQTVTLDRGAATVTLSFATLAAAERFDEDGHVVAYDPLLPEDIGVAYSARRFAFAAEYGLLDDLTIFGALPVRLMSVLRAEDAAPEEHTQFDFGDARIGFRLGLAERLGLPDATFLTIGLGLDIPLGYRRNVIPVIGSGQVDADLVASVGHRLFGDAAHVQAELGYRFRSRVYGFSRRVDCLPDDDDEQRCFPLSEDLSFSDEVLIRAEAGYEFFERILLRLLVDAVWSVETPQPVERFGGVFQPELFTERRGAAFGAALSGVLFEGATVSVTFLRPLGGRNVLNTHGLTFAFEISI